MTGPTVDDDVLAAGEAVLDSVVFVPDAEPPATPLSEARIASFTVDGADGELASGQIALPATWTVAESLTEEAPSRFLLRSNAPARDDGLDPTQGYLYLEVLDPAPTTEDYAQFWIDRSAEQFAPAGYELLDQSEVFLNGESGVRTVWTAAGEVVDEAFVVTGAVGVTVRFEFIAGTENPALLDDVVSRVVLIPTE